MMRNKIWILMIPWIPPNHILLAVIYSKSIMIVMFVFQASLQVGYTDIYIYIFQSCLAVDLTITLCCSLQLVNRNPNSHLFPKHSKSWSYGPQNHQDTNHKSWEQLKSRGPNHNLIRASRQISSPAILGFRAAQCSREGQHTHRAAEIHAAWRPWAWMK